MMTKQDLERWDCLEECLSELPPEDRFILNARFGLQDNKRMTLNTIGGFLCLSGTRIRQLQNRALRKLRIKMADRMEAAERKPELPRPETVVRSLWEPEDPATKYVRWAEDAIAALNGFIAGRQMQMRLSTSNEWRDFDLPEAIDRGMTVWRAKPRELEYKTSPKRSSNRSLQSNNQQGKGRRNNNGNAIS
jgi:DNA-directed RNA polymerase, sigma subunit (sigma70/sigma32)